MHTARSACARYGVSRSAVEYTATASSLAARQARRIRAAISPRLAMRTRFMGSRTVGIHRSAITFASVTRLARGAPGSAASTRPGVGSLGARASCPLEHLRARGGLSISGLGRGGRDARAPRKPHSRLP